MSMSFGSAFGSSDPFGELLNRFFGMSPATSPPAVQRVPIGRLLSEPSQELLNLAARRALEDGTPDLDTDHLLWAATQVEPSRGLLAQAGVDVEELAAQIAKVLPRESAEVSAQPGLTPAAKRTLAAAYGLSQAAGASYIGPEHILGALLEGEGTGAARLLQAAGLDVSRLRGLAERPARPARGEGAAAGQDGGTPSSLEEYGRDLTEEAKAGRLDPVVGRAEEIEQT
ncbi:Clp protease N-terminal domain-containing protein, partial [Streptomyces sp. NPDC006393]|uniref:Clp protease N-terminal domain-containing protein n=1 Tax=Streptomyces sp. NPDC006393 TaxID=3156763 RepID=UPI0033D8D0F3